MLDATCGADSGSLEDFSNLMEASFRTDIPDGGGLDEELSSLFS
jgi:hypothetical protein